MGQSLIEFREVSLGYGATPILHNLSFTVEEVDFFAAVEPNGAGKTTILRAILGILVPQAGEIRLANRAASPLGFGYVPQERELDPIFPLTAQEIVLMGRTKRLGPWRRWGNEDRRIALRSLEQAGIAHLAKTPFQELSGGQKQRTLIARALAAEPDVLVFDEPTAGETIFEEKSSGAQRERPELTAALARGSTEPRTEPRREIQIPRFIRQVPVTPRRSLRRARRAQSGLHVGAAGVRREVELDGAMYGARILGIEYGTGNPMIRDPMDSLGDAGNITDKFLNGTVMNNTADGVVEITNHFLGTKITLDMSDPLRPRRTSETGEVEEAGSNHEVWVDFAWTGPSEGDFFRPFNTIAAAAAAVADGGVIKITPGSTRERHSIPNNKQIRLVAPIGGVAIGVR